MSAPMHPDWSRPLGEEAMRRVRQYARDVESRAAMFDARAKREADKEVKP